ncbi:hypothetical protein EZV62_027470 [Acer yangbiense]|uniref:Uncharacterized protein n=1 Tax=Acer yangbiense TaxID=1000413 RepID=A0A5C7GVN0_9ROSI|nr:hypothetical protein EZV62_027470 [Acer yangbiense]
MVQRKLEGCIGSSNSCMVPDKGVNADNKKDVPGDKDFGGTLKNVVRRQKELIEKREDQGKRDSGITDLPTVLINNCELEVVAGLLSSNGLATIGLPVGPLSSTESMSLEMWKRITREKRLPGGDADLGKKKAGVERAGEIAKEDCSSSRKRDGGVWAAEGISSRKKKAIISDALAVAMASLEFAVSIAESEAGYVVPNEQGVVVSVSPKSVTNIEVSLDKEKSYSIPLLIVFSLQRFLSPAIFSTGAISRTRYKSDCVRGAEIGGVVARRIRFRRRSTVEENGLVVDGYEQERKTRLFYFVLCSSQKSELLITFALTGGTRTSL